MRSPRRVSWIALATLVVLSAGADLPPTPDAWTEFDSAAMAEAAGWFRECGLSQLIVVSEDCCAGAWSVGCEAVQARWQNRFGFAAPGDLAGLSGLRFAHVASWTGLDALPWNLWLVMEVTPEEQAAGLDLKRMHWTFDKAETWTTVELAFADAVWSWHEADSQMWRESGVPGTTELTSLVQIEWYINTFMGIAVGDQMLIDDLALVGGPTPVWEDIPASTRAAVLPAVPNPFNPATTLAFVMPGPGTVRLAVHDLTGRLVRTLRDGPCPAGTTTCPWDGRDDRGRTVPAGVYVVRLTSSAGDGHIQAVLVK